MNDLISKKELLALYGISYGALYRWKRMGLIPEEWFIKKSALTGQETYFDRSAICTRIEEILALKDSLSLEEISARLNGSSQQENPAEMLEIIDREGKITTLPLTALRQLTLVRTDGRRIDLITLIDKENHHE